MSFGNRRETALAGVLAVVLGWTAAGSALAGDVLHLRHTIPREVDAVDATTGGPYYAPPVPYGHYAKDHPLTYVDKAIGCIACKLQGLCGLGGCGLNHHCGDGKCGHGLGGRDGCGHGAGAGCGQGGHGDGCGHGHGSNGLFNGNGGHGHGSNGLFGGNGGHGHSGHGHGSGGSGMVGAATVNPAGGHHHHGGGRVVATAQAAPVATGQAAVGQAGASPYAQDPCGMSGCGLKGLHSHLGQAANPCGMSGCGLKGLHSHINQALNKIRCALCKGRGAGCGLCGGSGMADPCNGCGGRGCDGCGGLGCHGLGKGCGNLCGKLAGLGAKAHGALAGLFARRQKIDYFVGPGGPVPLTPGYVPYIVPTRSPRDFFSFAPMNPNDPYP